VRLQEDEDMSRGFTLPAILHTIDVADFPARQVTQSQSMLTRRSCLIDVLGFTGNSFRCYY
jgi:hypothetical protein